MHLTRLNKDILKVSSKIAVTRLVGPLKSIFYILADFISILGRFLAFWVFEPCADLSFYPNRYQWHIPEPKLLALRYAQKKSKPEHFLGQEI